MDRVVGSFCSRRREQGGGAADGAGERSAALALPAWHAASTADIYILTVGLFYRGLEHTHKKVTHE